MKNLITLTLLIIISLLTINPTVSQSDIRLGDDIIDIITTTQYDLLDVTVDNTRGVYDSLFRIPATLTISIYYGYDIIHVTKVADYEYKIECEECLYPIGIFNIDDVESLMYWITLYPADREVHDSDSYNNYYQELIEEKIWE